MRTKKNSIDKRLHARQVAAQILTRAERDFSFVDRELDKLLGSAALPRRDRALVTMLVNGVTRMRQRLDFEIAEYYQRDYQQAPELLKNILRMAFYQSEFLERVPDYAITSESVNLARKFFGEDRGRLVNAILRERQRRPCQWPAIEVLAQDIGLLAAYVSHPRWLLEKWLQRMPLSEVLALCETDNQIPAITLRVVHPEDNTSAFEQLMASGRIPIEILPHAPSFYRLRAPVHIHGLVAIRRGLCVVQDFSAGLVSKLIRPMPGEHIYDLCAAPGGKSLHMAESGATVIAVDINPLRARLIALNSARVGVPVQVVRADATSFAGKPADGVLVDAPCSGLGVLAKRADLRWQRQPEDLPELVMLQQRLLENAARLLRPGGRLVYATCTIEPEENETVVHRFLEAHPDFRLVSAADFVDKSFCDAYGFVRTLPHIHHIDGTFAARLERQK